MAYVLCCSRLRQPVSTARFEHSNVRIVQKQDAGAARRTGKQRHGQRLPAPWSPHLAGEGGSKASNTRATCTRVTAAPRARGARHNADPPRRIARGERNAGAGGRGVPPAPAAPCWRRRSRRGGSPLPNMGETKRVRAALRAKYATRVLCYRGDAPTRRRSKKGRTPG